MSVHPYLIITAGAMTSPLSSGKPGPPSSPSYPKWLRVYLIVLVSTVWAGLLIASAIEHKSLVDAKTHAVMMIVVASLFSVEFGGIRLVTKDKKDDSNV